MNVLMPINSIQRRSVRVGSELLNLIVAHKIKKLNMSQITLRSTKSKTNENVLVTIGEFEQIIKKTIEEATVPLLLLIDDLKKEINSLKDAVQSNV